MNKNPCPHTWYLASDTLSLKVGAWGMSSAGQKGANQSLDILQSVISPLTFSRIAKGFLSEIFFPSN